MRKLLIVLICIVAFSPVLPQTVTLNFSQNPQITWGSTQSILNKFTITSVSDVSNNIYFTGNYETTDLTYLKKINPKGEEIFTKNYSEKFFLNSNGQIRINPLNQLIVAGQKYVTPYTNRLRLLCLDLNGNVLWDITGPDNPESVKFYITDIKFDSDNNIYITSDIKLYPQDYFHVSMFKYSPTGQLLWQKIINTSARGVSNNAIYSMGETTFSMIITRAAFPNNYFTPYVISKETGEVIKFNLLLDAPSAGDFTYLAKVKNGNLYLANSNILRKFNSNLDTIWTRPTTGTSAMEIDVNEDVYVTGVTSTKCYTKDGVLKWTAGYTGTQSLLENNKYYLYTNNPNNSVFNQLDINGNYVLSSEKYNPFNNSPQFQYWFSNQSNTPSFTFSGIATEPSLIKHYYNNNFSKDGLFQYSLMEGYNNDFALDFKYYNNFLYTCGYTKIRESYSTAFINKFTTSGTLLWSKNIFNNTDYSGTLTNIYPDNIEILGTGELQDGPSLREHAELVSLDQNGNINYNYSFKNLLEGRSSGKVVKKSGNSIYVAGQYKDSLNQIKVFLSKNIGNENIWIKKFNPGISIDSLVSLSVDTLGSVFISYNSIINNIKSIYTVIKINADGDIQYNTNHQDNDGLFLKKSETDKAGYLYTLASVKVNDNYDLLTQKLDNNGIVVWSDTYANTLNTDDLAADLAIGRDNSITIASNTVNPNFKMDAFVMKINITGERVWNKNYAANNKFIVKNIFSDDMSYRYIFGKNIDASNQERVMFLQYDPLGNLKNTIGYNPHDTLTLSFSTDFVGAYVADLAGSNKKIFSTSNVNRINRGSDVRINSFSGNVIVTDINSGSETADKFSLSQNYPNPFNPVTTIKFSLPSEGFAKLTVYDVNGREVNILVNENLTNGVYDKSFDGSNLASGIYFYKLEFTGANGQKFSEKKKLILIK